MTDMEVILQVYVLNPTDNKPLREPGLTSVYVAIWRPAWALLQYTRQAIQMSVQGTLLSRMELAPCF